MHIKPEEEMDSKIASIVDKKISNVLNEFLKVNGVTTAAIVGRDGFVIESTANSDIDMDALGAMVATAVGTAESLGREFGFENMDQYLSEFSQGKVIMATVKDDILALFTDTSAIIGAVRFAIKKSMPDVLQTLR